MSVTQTRGGVVAIRLFPVLLFGLKNGIVIVKTFNGSRIVNALMGIPHSYACYGVTGT